MPELSRRPTWVRAGDRYPDLKGVPDDFIAMDGEVEVGTVKLVPAPAEAEWMWSLYLVHEGPRFGVPTNGRTQTRGEAARELIECWQKFRAYYGIED